MIDVEQAMHLIALQCFSWCGHQTTLHTVGQSFSSNSSGLGRLGSEGRLGRVTLGRLILGRVMFGRLTLGRVMLGGSSKTGMGTPASWRASLTPL
jgi:hypothetical protein